MARINRWLKGLWKSIM